MKETPQAAQFKAELAAFLAAHYEEASPAPLFGAARSEAPAPAPKKSAAHGAGKLFSRRKAARETAEAAFFAETAAAPAETTAGAADDVHDFVEEKREDESFTDYLLRAIREQDLTEPEVYNRVFMDRKLFNKIRNDPDYQPSKRTALLLAIALHLTLAQTQEFLGKAGFAITHASKFDLIVEFFILKENYDVLQINEILEEFGQPLLLKCD